MERDWKRKLIGALWGVRSPEGRKELYECVYSLSHSHVSLLGIQDVDPFLCYIVRAALMSTVKTPSQSEKFYNEGKGKGNSH